MDARITPDTRHLVPDPKETEKRGHPTWRHALGEEYLKYEVDHVQHRRTLHIDEDDPFTVALLFREIRRVTNFCDIGHVSCELTVELEGMSERESANVDELLAMSWSSIGGGLPEVHRIYYKERES